MSKKKAGILSLIGYLVTMGIGLLIGNGVSNLLGENVLGTMNMDSSNIIYKIIIQIPPTVFLLCFIKKYYNGKSPKNFNSLKFNYNIILFKNQENIAYSTIGKDFYVVSYIENNKIIYQKVMFKEDAYIVFYASYLAKDKNFMDKIVTEMANSIKFLK